MKRILFSLLIIMAGAATAGAFTLATWGTDMPSGLTGKLSTNVQLWYNHSSDQSGYIAATSHEKGTKTYASSSGDATIYSEDATLASDLPSTIPSGTASAAWGSTWSSL